MCGDGRGFAANVPPRTCAFLAQFQEVMPFAGTK